MQFVHKLEWKNRTDGRTDTTDCSTLPANGVSKFMLNSTAIGVLTMHELN